MKTLWNIMSVIAIAHLLALIGFGGFLFQSDRISRDRLEAVRAVFQPTLAEEQAALDQAVKDGTASVEGVSTINGNGSEEPSAGVAQRIKQLQTVEELVRERELRFDRDRQLLMSTLSIEHRKLEQERVELDAERTAFTEMIQHQKELREDEQFQKMVDILKGLSGKDLKAKFDALLQDGKMETVVDIIDAFDKRTAQKVLKEYQTAEENILAADLLIRIKDRGLTLGTP